MAPRSHRVYTWVFKGMHDFDFEVYAHTNKLQGPFGCTFPEGPYCDSLVRSRLRKTMQPPGYTKLDSNSYDIQRLELNT